MTTTTELSRSPWDFSSVIDFVNTLTPHKDVVNDHLPGLSEPLATKDEPGHDKDDASHLGDFSKVWRFLGSPTPTSELPSAPSKEDYASDGATYTLQASLRKAPSIGTDAEELTASASDAPAHTLTKTQRKKLRRKERKAAEEARRIQHATVSESEAEYPSISTPARKASAHVVPHKLSALQAASNTIREIKQNKKKESGMNCSATITTTNTPVTSVNSKVSDDEAVNAVANAMAALKKATEVLPSTPTPKGPSKRYNSRSNAAVQFTPSTVQPQSAVKPAPAPAVQPFLRPPSTPSRQPYMTKPIIQPAIVRSGEDREWALLLKIINDFSADRKYLVSPMNMTTHNNDPKGIHVFVDASNIFIGFMDQLKRSRNIHPLAKVPEVVPSFDALALLMERRRPVARRILAGSTPHLAAFDKAKDVGYECNILEKVYKARELTDRQIYFKELDAKRFGKTPKRAPPVNTVDLSSLNPYSVGLGNASGNGSGSETNTPQYAPPKMIEQGVDEILHLKILESIVDWDEPSTMVLATGDAAAAEYSPGFMAMAGRALKKGWTVELVSWSKNISGMYKRPQWIDAWGDRFRIVYLDDYAEELLDM